MYCSNCSEKIILYCDNGEVSFPRNGREYSTVSRNGIEKEVLNALRFCYPYFLKPIEEIKGLEKILESEDNIVKKIPEAFEINEKNDVSFLMIGDKELTKGLVDTTKKSGVIGYWNSKSILICVTKDFVWVLEEVKKILKPDKAKFVLIPTVSGFDLVIQKIDKHISS